MKSISKNNSVYTRRFGFYPQFAYKGISDVTIDVKTVSFTHGVIYTI